MDLDFSVNKTTYLQKIFEIVRHQEETIETVVPDSFPDVAAIIDAFGAVYLRGKDCRNGNAVVSGAVKAGILYHPDDGSSPRTLDLYTPFTINFDSPCLSEGSQFRAGLKIASIDGRMINSRKVLLRVNVACEIEAYNIETISSYRLNHTDSCLQLKTQTLSAYIPSEVAERAFVINDTIDLSGASDFETQVNEVSLCCSITDKKTVGSKAVFKGILLCKLLLRDQDNSLRCNTFSFPFSQYCELIHDYDDAILSVHVTVTGCEIQSNQDGTRQINVNLLSQCLIYNKYEDQYIDDAYCTDGVLTPQWEQTDFTCVLDRKSDKFTGRFLVPGKLMDILDIEFYDDFPAYRRDGDTMQVNIPTLIRVLGYDENNVLCSLYGRGELSGQYALSDGGLCHAQTYAPENYSVQKEQTAMEVRCSMQGELNFTTQQHMRSLSGGNVDETPKKDERKPSVILLNVFEEQPLWNIAKSYRTTVETLQRANNIDGVFTPDHGMLLIPTP